MQFLQYTCTQWNQYSSYQLLEETVKSLKVVNDGAEKGVRLLEDYEDILTEDRNERNLIMQCLED